MTTAPLTNTLACVTISNPAPERQADLLRLIGWRQAAEGAIDASLEKLWGIGPGNAGKRFSVWQSPGSDWGMIRVVQGPDRYPTRQIGARWSGIEIIVMKDIDGLYEKLQKSGLFKVFVPPTNYDFTHVGSNIHRAMVGRMPGGTHIVFTMAVTAPKGRAFPSSPNDVGHIFAVHLVAKDFKPSFAFYREDLGMPPYLEDHLEHGLWHDTWSLPDGTPVDLGTVRGNVPGTGRGAIEMQGYPDTVIDPIAITRDKLDGGSCIATYTADDIDATFKVVKGNKQATVLSEPMAMAGAPYNGGRAFCFLGPSGERFEVAERFVP